MSIRSDPTALEWEYSIINDWAEMASPETWWLPSMAEKSIHPGVSIEDAHLRFFTRAGSSLQGL